MKALFVAATLLLTVVAAALAATEDQRFREMELQASRTRTDLTVVDHRVSSLERKLKDYPETGLVLFLFGTVCALWAQNSGRSGWLWFFLGLFFSLITVLVLLFLNSEEVDKRRSKI